MTEWDRRHIGRICSLPEPLKESDTPQTPIATFFPLGHPSDIDDPLTDNPRSGADGYGHKQLIWCQDLARRDEGP